MAIFNSYVKLPEGTNIQLIQFIEFIQSSTYPNCPNPPISQAQLGAPHTAGQQKEVKQGHGVLTKIPPEFTAKSPHSWRLQQVSISTRKRQFTFTKKKHSFRYQPWVCCTAALESPGPRVHLGPPWGFHQGENAPLPSGCADVGTGLQLNWDTASRSGCGDSQIRRLAESSVNGEVETTKCWWAKCCWCAHHHMLTIRKSPRFWKG